jgi:DNA-binding XRE family transcriptional regulator
MTGEPPEILELRRVLGERLTTFRKAADVTQARLASSAYLDRSTVSHIERGRARGGEAFWRVADQLTGAGGQLVTAFHRIEVARRGYESDVRSTELAAFRAEVAGPCGASPTVWGAPAPGLDDELAAVELARRVAASDVGDETLARLELAFDELAMAYPVTPPAELSGRLRTYLAYVGALVDSRMTLAERRRLVVVGAWLSLLAATVHVDLNQVAAAGARMRTAAGLARQAGHDTLRAWCFETEAWRVLTAGDHRRAVELSLAAQEIAPAGSSVAVQASAQEGRARARLGERRETYRVLGRVERLVSPLARPERAEHHYRYDPDKSVAYLATTLAWLGDPAAEGCAREVIARLGAEERAGGWPRRVAVANLDLALALLVTGRLDEACAAAYRAIGSGRVVASNHWRAAEVIEAVEARGLPEAPDLREAYERLRG